MSPLNLCIVHRPGADVASVHLQLRQLGYTVTSIPHSAAKLLWDELRSNFDLAFVGEDITNQEFAALRQASGMPIATLSKRPLAQVDLRGRMRDALRKWSTQPGRDVATQGMVLKSGAVYYRVMPSEVVYIEAHRNYLDVHGVDSFIKVRATVKQIERILPEDDFLRPHRSYLVNRRYVTGLRRGFLLTADKRIPVSDSGRAAVVDHFRSVMITANLDETKLDLRQIERESRCYMKGTSSRTGTILQDALNAIRSSRGALVAAPTAA